MNTKTIFITLGLAVAIVAIILVTKTNKDAAMVDGTTTADQATATDGTATGTIITTTDLGVAATATDPAAPANPEFPKTGFDPKQ